MTGAIIGQAAASAALAFLLIHYARQIAHNPPAPSRAIAYPALAAVAILGALAIWT